MVQGCMINHPSVMRLIRANGPIVNFNQYTQLTQNVEETIRFDFIDEHLIYGMYLLTIT